MIHLQPTRLPVNNKRTKDQRQIVPSQLQDSQQEKKPMLKRISNLLRFPTICSHNTHGKIKSNIFADKPCNNKSESVSYSPTSFESCSTLKRCQKSEHSFVEILSPPHRRGGTGTGPRKMEPEQCKCFTFDELSSAYTSIAYPRVAPGRSATTDTSLDNISNIIYSENLKEFLYPQLIRTVKLPMPKSNLNPGIVKSKSVKKIESELHPPAEPKRCKNRKHLPGSNEALHPLVHGISGIESTTVELACQNHLPLQSQVQRSHNTCTIKNENKNNYNNLKVECQIARDNLALIKNSVRRIQLKAGKANLVEDCEELQKEQITSDGDGRLPRPSPIPATSEEKTPAVVQQRRDVCRQKMNTNIKKFRIQTDEKSNRNVGKLLAKN